MKPIKPEANFKKFLVKTPHHILIIILLTLSLVRCASIQPQPPEIPLDIHTANGVLSDIQEQDTKVSTFYSIGTMTVKDWKWDTDADMLIIGQKNPFRIKIEITHQWKGPVLHILINEETLEVLSFSENKLYLGTFTPENLAKFIPGSFFDSGLIWSTLRAYPYLMDHQRSSLYETNRISLLNTDNMEIEIIELLPESLYPSQVMFPDHGLNLTFSSIKDIDGILYAERVEIKNAQSKYNLLLNNRKMVFNQPVPEKIFSIQRVPNYETVYLDEQNQEPGT